MRYFIAFACMMGWASSLYVFSLWYMFCTKCVNTSLPRI
jgi:hypothetical protein